MTQDSNQYFATGASQPTELGRFLLETMSLSSMRLGAGDTLQAPHDIEVSKSLRTESISTGLGSEPLSTHEKI